METDHKSTKAGPKYRITRIKARQLFPDAPITLKKHDGRAEALLIAEFGRREHLGLETSGGKRRRR